MSLSLSLCHLLTDINSIEQHVRKKVKLTAPADLDKEQTLDLDKYLVCVMELLGPPYVAQILIMLSYS